MKSRPLIERFNEKVSPEALTGCWLWTGCVNQDGYGKIRLTRQREIARATHVSWDLFRREERAGRHVLHSCDTPACVAPHHLFLGTQQENMDDMHKKRRGPFAGRTHCKSGHELNEENTYLGTGYRRCRTCSKQQAQDARSKKAPAGRA